jgi:AraC family transcriptional regulator of adaptative response/methylated-DNA-[protein]-cysteine methyltransferase
MLFDLPEKEVLYTALLSRDPAFDRKAFVGVTTTGIFCRFTCPARKPKAENCEVFESVAQCMEAGFRPCKRCKPLDPESTMEPTVRFLMDELTHNPSMRWMESDVIKAGFDPSTVRRAFRREFGVTFLELARLYRLREGFKSLSTGEKVIEAQLDASFDSSSGFREAFTRLLGQAPARFMKGEGLLCNWMETPLGPMIAVADPHRLHLLEFADRKALAREMSQLQAFSKGRIGIGRYQPIEQVEDELTRYFRADKVDFSTPLHLHGSSFTKSVWAELQRIPANETRSYLDIAKAVGRPTASRAIARANGANQIAILIPCHRVIGSDGSMTGYGGGIWRKRRLLEIEQEIAGKPEVHQRT